jgi:hypothetical protein
VGRAGEATRRKEVVRFARDTVRVNKKMLPVRITKEWKAEIENYNF